MADLNVKKVRTADLELKDRLVAINRVTKVTKGGRHFSFAAIVVVGDENGVVGYGLGKANEVTTAIAKGVEDAKKNLIRVPLDKRTIPHEQTAKFGGAKVFMKPAAPGTGVEAGGAMRAVFEAVGIQDVIAKSKGSSNPHNLVKATIAALSEIRDAYTVAGMRGIPMNRVFNGLRRRRIMDKSQSNSGYQQVRRYKRQIENLKSLGIRKIHNPVEVELNPVTEGMLRKVAHLVTVEEIK
jgi:small subunit ribosomal protein S5